MINQSEPLEVEISDSTVSVVIASMGNTILNGPEVKEFGVGDTEGATFVGVASSTGLGSNVAIAEGEIVEPGISLDVQPARRNAVNKRKKNTVILRNQSTHDDSLEVLCQQRIKTL